jgi:hypothetical protein
MLLKAAILERGGRIREKGKPNTIGFDRCVGIGLSQGDVSFLSEEDAVVLRTVNGLRDAAQHYVVDLAEQTLYIQAQAGVTAFRKLMKEVFDLDLTTQLPDRVLPICTTPPTDLATLFDGEIQHVRKLLEPGRRQRLEAMAKLRGLAIVEGAIRGPTNQPSPADLFRLGRAAMEGKPWNELFPGVATVKLTATGTGPAIELRITKNEGIPVQLVRENLAPGVPVVAIKRVDETGFYKLSRDGLAEKLALSPNLTSAIIWHIDLKEDPLYHKAFVFGKQTHHRYSDKAIERITKLLEAEDKDEIWRRYIERNKRKGRGDAHIVVPAPQQPAHQPHHLPG